MAGYKKCVWIIIRENKKHNIPQIQILYIKEPSILWHSIWKVITNSFYSQTWCSNHQRRGKVPSLAFQSDIPFWHPSVMRVTKKKKGLWCFSHSYYKHFSTSSSFHIAYLSDRLWHGLSFITELLQSLFTSCQHECSCQAMQVDWQLVTIFAKVIIYLLSKWFT